MITFKIFLRTDHLNLDGTNTVNIRLINKRKKKDISLKIYVFTKNWNPSTNRVRKTGKDFARNNRIITKYENKARNIIDDHFIDEKDLNFNIFLSHFMKNDVDESSFYDYVLDKLENRNMAHETYKAYKSQISKLKRFQNKATFTDLTPSFVHKYKKFLIEVVGNNENTTYKSLRGLKAFINWAIEDELMEKNPFKSIKTRHVEGKREYLSILELEKIEKLYFNGTLKYNLQNVLRYFLFSCYTGLRYTDIKELRFSC